MPLRPITARSAFENRVDYTQLTKVFASTIEPRGRYFPPEMVDAIIEPLIGRLTASISPRLTWNGKISASAWSASDSRASRWRSARSWRTSRRRLPFTTRTTISFGCIGRCAVRQLWPLAARIGYGRSKNLSWRQTMPTAKEWIERNGDNFAPCWICAWAFARRRDTRRFCSECHQGFCEGEHGSFAQGTGKCVVCLKLPASKRPIEAFVIAVPPASSGTAPSSTSSGGRSN